MTTDYYLSKRLLQFRKIPDYCRWQWHLKKENELVSTRSAYFRVSQKRHTLKKAFGCSVIDDCLWHFKKGGSQSVGNQSIVAGVLISLTSNG
jgi:hypothetical protein